MFGFHKKTLSEGERVSWEQEIQQLLEADAFEKAFKKAKEYEKCEKAAAAYYLAKLYVLGKGVRQDLDKAQIYIEMYTKQYPDDQEGWFLQSSIMLAAGNRDEATDCLYRSEQLGRCGMDRHIAEYCAFQGMNYYNTACLTLNAGQRASFSKKAEQYFVSSNERYEKILLGNGDCADGVLTMTENDWTQLGYNLHYLHYIALNGNDAEKTKYWEDQANEMLAGMEKAGYEVRAAYTRAMFAENIANLHNSAEALEKAKQYLEQADGLAGDQAEIYHDEYELVWKEYDRIYKILKNADKKGIFGKRSKK